MAIISGTLTDGTGQIINNCTIVLHAKRTTATVLNQTQAFNVASNGAYKMTVSPCDYDVLLLIDGFPPKKLGQIQVFSTSKNGTLNDFLLLPQTGQPITPAVLEQITDERVKAQAAATAAKVSENNAASTLAGAVKKSGDTMTGELKIQKSEPKLFLLNSLGNGLILHTQENNNVLFSYAFDGKSDYKLAYSKELNTFIFRNLDDVEINGYSILKKGDGGLLSYTSTVEDMFSSDITTGFYRFDTKSVNTPVANSYGYINKIAWNANEAKLMAYAYNSHRTFTGFKDKNTGNISFVEFITTANSTVDSNGFYKKASPILRLYATDELDNVEGYFKAGYGLVNSEAHGVTAKRISVGHYEVYGSLGFAKEGWYITLPEDANGNKKIFAEYWVDENNVITIKTYTKKFDFEKCEVVAGEPIDITDARWIDVRLEMPVIEIIEQEEPIPSTLNPIVSEVSE